MDNKLGAFLVKPLGLGLRKLMLAGCQTVDKTQTGTNDV
jgi:hypothetical protein